MAVAGDFAPSVLADAERAAHDVELPDEDATDVALVTVDPAGSRDLDQAVHLARDDDGYVVTYAIADVASFVRPGSSLADEALRRGETLYFPDARVPLYPPSLSEGAASLLPNELRPAVVWRIALDAVGNVRSVDVRRARVRSRAQFDYSQVERDLAARSAHPALALLPDVGARRLALARARHAINLDLPAQEVERAGDGWRLVFRQPLTVEDYNAELSLLTGMCAAQLMLDHHHGILRTLPEPDARTVASLRRTAGVLGVDWPPDAAPGDVLAGLDRVDPRHVALIDHAGALLRGAGYTSFVDAAPPLQVHAGIGAPYAHVTAPLRRLVDVYASEICLALSGGTNVPVWVDERLADLPAVMRASDQRAHAVDHAVVDMTEAWLLRDRVGERFDVLVIDADDHAATVLLDEPPVRARCGGDHLPVGERVGATLVEADVERRTVRFAC